MSKKAAPRPNAPGAGWGCPDVEHGSTWRGDEVEEWGCQLDPGPDVAAAPQPSGQVPGGAVHVIPSLRSLSLTWLHCADELRLGTRAHN